MFVRFSGESTGDQAFPPSRSGLGWVGGIGLRRRGRSKRRRRVGTIEKISGRQRPRSLASALSIGLGRPSTRSVCVSDPRRSVDPPISERSTSSDCDAKRSRSSRSRLVAGRTEDGVRVHPNRKEDSAMCPRLAASPGRRGVRHVQRPRRSRPLATIRRRRR